jgi:hypothetical protein
MNRIFNQGNPLILRNVSSAKPIKVQTDQRFRQILPKTPNGGHNARRLKNASVNNQPSGS